MAEEGTDFVNPYWHRLGRGTPSLSDQARLQRQEIRGRLWFILTDDLTGRQVRLTPEAWYFVGLLDGTRTVEEAIAAAAEHLGEDAPGQSDAIRLLGQLHAAGLLHTPQDSADTEALHQRGATYRRRRITQQLKSPLAIRFPLVDPDRFLLRILPLGRAIFSLPGLLVWLGVIGWGLGTVALNWDALSTNFLDRVFSADNIVLMTIVFVVLKVCHEIGHGLAVRRWGGAVNEMGIMLLVMIPVPYADATSANEFPTRLRRIAVSAAGMYVEMFLAALAIILWAKVEPGLLRATLYNAALIGSVSTLLFNLNPLLRFDGYYILSDLISMPNLGTRGTKYLKYLTQRYVLRLEDATTPETDRAEKRWLASYAIAALAYRFFIVAVIALVVAQRLFFVGVLLALWAVVQLVVLPVVSGIRFLLTSPRLRGHRTGAIARATLATAVVGALLFVLPAPRSSYAYGVVWVPEEGEIFAASDGFVDEVLAADGADVAQGAVLIEMRNDPLAAQQDRLEARLTALDAKARSDFVSDRTELQVTRLEIDQIRLRLEATERDLRDLSIRAATTGTFALAVPEDLPGSFVRRGDRLGFIIGPDNRTVRVAVGQRNIGLLRDGIDSISLRPVVIGGAPVEAQLVRAIPAASAELPSLALSTHGGGRIPVAADETGQPRAVEDVFHFEVAATSPLAGARVGQKVHVKFRHSPEPVGFQVYRRLRQLFLSEFNV